MAADASPPRKMAFSGYGHAPPVGTAARPSGPAWGARDSMEPPRRATPCRPFCHNPRKEGPPKPRASTRSITHAPGGGGTPVPHDHRRGTTTPRYSRRAEWPGYRPRLEESSCTSESAPDPWDLASCRICRLRETVQPPPSRGSRNQRAAPSHSAAGGTPQGRGSNPAPRSPSS
jgi:hypothetical protein